jgi:hypothetical protein
VVGFGRRLLKPDVSNIPANFSVRRFSAHTSIFANADAVRILIADSDFSCFPVLILAGIFVGKLIFRPRRLFAACHMRAFFASEILPTSF